MGPSSSAVSSYLTDQSAVKIRAQALLGCLATVTLWHGGRNSRVYRVLTSGGTFALKVYPNDGRDRARREFDATTLFARAGVAQVPRPIAIDEARCIAMYSWVDGEPIGEITLRDIDLLADFAAELYDLRTTAEACAVPNAVEACFDERAVLAQIELRLDRFVYLHNEPKLQEFLSEHFAPVLAAERTRVLATNQQRRNRVVRTLSPSDFGFHNALRTSSTSMSFLDFEYFGWDDPVKLTADVCWHPAMALTLELQRYFLTRCTDIYRDDSQFEPRLRTGFALYGLRWCLIVLNEFLPPLWQRRVAAGITLPASEVLPAQLVKAYSLLGRVVRVIAEIQQSSIG